MFDLCNAQCERNTTKQKHFVQISLRLSQACLDKKRSIVSTTTLKFKKAATRPSHAPVVSRNPSDLRHTTLISSVKTSPTAHPINSSAVILLAILDVLLIIAVRLRDCGGAACGDPDDTCEKRHSFLSAFPMFVPSLSWLNVRLYI
jgi:hypothetical protein